MQPEFMRSCWHQDEYTMGVITVLGVTQENFSYRYLSGYAAICLDRAYWDEWVEAGYLTRLS